MASKELTLDIPSRDQAGERREPGWSTHILSENPQYVKFTREATQPVSSLTYGEDVDTMSTPPLYDSVFGKVKGAYEESSGICDFFIVISIGILILGITVGIPISMLVMGRLYLHKCPVNIFIPIYLLTGGCCGLLKVVLHLLNECMKKNCSDNSKHANKCCTFGNYLCFFMMIWFILGSYWVYRDYEPNYDSSKRYYCNHTLYTFAFWQVTSGYIILGAGFLLFCGAKIFN